jgi:hypothetical protein
MTAPKAAVDKPQITPRTVEAELVERVFGPIAIDALPTVLSATLLSLAKVATEMHPDDVSLSLDLPAGTLSFRCYRRTEVRS